MNTGATCTHCGLPVGCLGQHREVNGESLAFCCYGCCLAYQVHHGDSEEPAAAALLIRLGVGAFLAMNIMLFSLMHYADAFATTPELGVLVSWLLWALATPLMVLLGTPFLTGAWQAWGEGRLGADALVTLGIGAAYLYSAWQVLVGSEQVYFDTAAMVLMLFTLGRYVDAEVRVRTARSLAPLLVAESAPVRIVGAAAESVRTARAVRVGDIVRILPGERVGVDGTVVEGWSACDETVLTGQSQPQPKRAGDTIHAGSINGNGMLLVRAGTDGSATRWVMISHQVREALSRKSLLAETVDRVAGMFVPAILLIAIATFWYWRTHGDLNHALLTSVAVLVVACPCSLGLAAPLAATLGITRAAHQGILIRGGAVLEKLTRLRGIAFDKTGTLTQGLLQMVAFHGDGATPPAEVLHRAQSLALASDHPIARALAGMPHDKPVFAAQLVQAKPGAGLLGSIDGVASALGSASFMARMGWLMPLGLTIMDDESGGHTVAYVGWDGQVRGRFDFVDGLRPEAAAAIETVRARGLRTLVLSGDSRAAVARTAAILAIDEWQAELYPESKVSVLRHWQAQNGALAMVGDAINDGPILAEAAVGIAVSGASDLAQQSADVTLPAGGLAKIAWLIDLALDVRRSVRANLIWAFAYNAIAVALAACGYLQPVLAAALMAGSSLLVVARSLRAHVKLARNDAPSGELGLASPRGESCPANLRQR